MYFNKRFKLLLSTIFIAILIGSNLTFANTKMDEFDTLRAELNCIKDKDSPQFVKTKEKLEKIIKKEKINYNTQTRFNDALRLMQEQKYNSARYELNDLIIEGYNVSKCYELLGDISKNCSETKREIANYYKLAIQNDEDNFEALYKLSKLYLSENKNILGIEYLKKAINKATYSASLEEIEYIILNKITPKNRYEANNLYEALGDIYMKLKNKNASYQAYNKAIQINPKDIYLKYHLSGLLYEDGYCDDAIAIIDSILGENRRDSQIKTLKAKSFLKKGNYLSANKEYIEILSEFPNSNQAKYGIYEIYQDKLSPKEILKKIANNNEYNPTISDIEDFSNFLNSMEDFDGAEKFNKYALKLKQEQELIAKKQAELARKQAELAKKQEELARIKKQEELIKKEKEKELKAKEKKNIATKKQSTIKKKEQTKKKVIAKPTKLNPDKKLSKTKENISKKEIIKKEEKLQNIKSKEELIKEEKEKEARLIEEERAKAIAKNKEKYYKLKNEADNYLKISPKEAKNIVAAANVYKQMGEPTSALKLYKEAMKLEPTNSDIYYNLGLTYFELNSNISAKVNLTKAINLDEENTKAKNLLAFVNQKINTSTINQAYDLYEKKDYIKSFEILDKGIKDYPTNSQLYYYRALVYCAMNRNGAAIIDLQKAIEFDPSHYMAYYQLGQTYEKVKDERSALVAYERFLSIEPEEKELVDEIQKKVIDLGEKYY